MTTEQKQNTPSTKWEVEKLIKGLEYKQNMVINELKDKTSNIPSPSDITNAVQNGIADYMEENPHTVSGLTIDGAKIVIGNPNNYTVYQTMVNIGDNNQNTYSSNNVIVGYGLDAWGNSSQGVNAFGKYNTTNGWSSSSYPAFFVGTGTSSSPETALAYINYNGNCKWYLKGIGYDDASGFTANGNQDLKSYIDEGDYIIAPDDVVDYFRMPCVKVDISVDASGNVTITSDRQTDKLPIDESSKYWASNTQYMFSSVTPTWTDNNDGTYTYTLPASTTNPTGYKRSQYMMIYPTNFIVDDGVTYRVTFTTMNEFSGNIAIMQNKDNKLLSKNGGSSQGNRHKPSGMTYNPNCDNYYYLTANQLAKIL